VLQVARRLYMLSILETKRPDLTPMHLSLVANMLTPLVVFFESTSGGGGGNGGSGGDSSGGGDDRSVDRWNKGLSSEAAAARRKLCLLHLDFFQPNPMRLETFFTLMAICFGLILRLNYPQAVQLVQGPGFPDLETREVTDPDTAMTAFALHTMSMKALGPSLSPDKRKPLAWVPSDPFLGPLLRRRACSNCGLLPPDFMQCFQICSLCKDPAAGQFCCREPCFAAFWRGGHKNTCAGRGKGKKGKEAGK
jgi:hypothetical protein